MVSRMGFPTTQATNPAIFEYLQIFYNTRRLRSALGYRSPADFEEDRMEQARLRKFNVSALAGEAHPI